MHMDRRVGAVTRPAGARVSEPRRPASSVGVAVGHGPDGRRLRHHFTAVLLRYPVTAVVLAPYAVLIVPLAVVNDNPSTGFVVRLLGLALAGTLGLETLALLARRPSPGWHQALRQANSRFPRIYLVARLVALVSIAADVAGAYAGRGTIASQVAGEGASSSLVSLTSLVAGWKYLAFALLLASFLGGRAGRRGVYAWILALIGAQVVVASLDTILAPCSVTSSSWRASACSAACSGCAGW
ncbi:hypothetical protein [Micromonospora sp. NPDC093277]|uniref:hypothetical protein n=1 Tax=Micromonospora sp. NPDC093277 TaxID=3364291 RepID=UPI00382952D0